MNRSRVVRRRVPKDNEVDVRGTDAATASSVDAADAALLADAVGVSVESDAANERNNSVGFNDSWANVRTMGVMNCTRLGNLC